MSHDLRRGFGDFGGRVWLNCSHQGPLPLAAAAEAQEAVSWKVRPHEMTTERFGGVPARTKAALSRLLGVPSEQVILTNGASYGLHLLANGLPLGEADEVLLMTGDFPSNLLPWQGLSRRGIISRFIRPRRFVPTADEVRAEITPQTRVLCLSWIHSFSGHVARLDDLGELCQRHRITLIANVTQGLGARALQLSGLAVDAVVGAGWKWLCGPYATGFCWMRPELCATLDYNQAYWLSSQTADDLAETSPVDSPPVARAPTAGARRYDVFGTANFFNFKPWSAALELLLELGLDRIESHDRALTEELLAGYDARAYELISPQLEGTWSPLVFLSHRRPELNQEIFQLLKEEGIDIALRRGALRLSPHLYNTAEDVQRALEVLARFGR